MVNYGSFKQCPGKTTSMFAQSGWGMCSSHIPKDRFFSGYSSNYMFLHAKCELTLKFEIVFLH